MSDRARLLLRVMLLAGDALGVTLALFLAYQAVVVAGPLDEAYRQTVLLAIPAYLAVFGFQRLYDVETVLEDSQEYATAATGCTYGAVLTALLGGAVGHRDLSLVWVFAAWLLSVLLVGAARFAMRRVVRALRRAGHLLSSAIIVGADEQGRAIARQFRSVVDSGVQVLGFVDDFLPAGTPVQDGLTVLGHPDQLAALAREHRVGEIVVVPGALAWETFQQILEHMSLGDGPRFRFSPGYYDLLATTPRVAHRNFVPLIIVDSARLSGFDALMKTGLDYGLGLILWLLTLPLLWLLAAWLRLARRGPIFERGEYLGIGGRTFHAATFRVDPDGAPRAARLLDNTGLNRLPMLASVLLGKMSLVGPRTLRP
ncbi:MAG: sugar transferase, partial [Chloroflexi bacterium]|nr:sugar transferase [Chloroflexota bacterium]